MIHPKVSIVIACYNDPEVKGAVRSAFAQTYKNKEIILVDDGSDKENERVINSLEPYVNLILRQENGGQGRARNQGIELATGELILNLDSDDYFEEDFCEKAVAIFEKNQDVKIVICKAKRFNKKGIIDVFVPKGGDIKDFLFANSALGSSMFKMSDWQKCGGYEEDLNFWGFEDWEFYIRLLKSGGYAHVIQEELFNYQIRENSTTDIIRPHKHQRYKSILLKHQDLYKDNFKGTIEHLFKRIEKIELEKEKIKKDKGYVLGRYILKPLRLIWRKKNNF